MGETDGNGHELPALDAQSEKGVPGAHDCTGRAGDDTVQFTTSRGSEITRSNKGERVRVFQGVYASAMPMLRLAMRAPLRTQ